MRKYVVRVVSVVVSAIMIFNLTACNKHVEIEPVDGWYATWTAAQLAAEKDQTPQNPRLRGNTLRQQVKTSIGGDKIRLTFSNEYGDTPLVIESVHVAKLKYPGSPDIDVATDTVVTFDGSQSVTIRQGKTTVSDEINFSFEALETLGVTVKFGDYVPSVITCHREADCTCWIVSGDHISDERFSAVSLMSSFYFLSRVDTWAVAGTETLVCFGDSITDGDGSTYNGFNSWPESLSKLLQSDHMTNNISVVNTAIAGNGIYSGDGTSAKERFERDVLDVAGVRRVIILIGANDIASAQYDTSSEYIEEYKNMIAACHERGIKIYAGTLTPFDGNTVYYSELHEKIRMAVNEFIMSADSGFDGYVDFSEILCYPENPAKIQSIYDSGDGLHPNASGYEAMAKAAREMLIEAWTEEMSK